MVAGLNSKKRSPISVVTGLDIRASLIAQFVISRIVNFFYENLAIFLDLFTALNKTAAVDLYRRMMIDAHRLSTVVQMNI